jgi:hypothetical protein
MSFLTFKTMSLGLAFTLAWGCSDDDRTTGGGGSTTTDGGSTADGGNGAGGNGGGIATGGGSAGGGSGGFDANGFCSADGWCWENPTPQGHALNDVWVANGEAVAVGRYGTILRFDGNSWSRDALPGFSFPNFSAVWGPSVDDLFAVGDGVFHSDGSAWVELVTPITEASAIWGTSASSLWVAGGSFLYRFDGSDWTVEDNGDMPFIGLTGTSDSDVWAITEYDIWHRDAVGWTSIAIDSLTPPPVGTLTAIWAAGENDVWAVGGNGTLLHYDGSWSVEPSLGNEAIVDIWGSGPDDVHAVIDEVTDGQPNMAHWDGSDWTLTFLLDDNPPSAISGDSATDIWMVGRHGQLRHYDGTTATELSRNLLSGSVETAIWANAPDDVWTIGNERALHFDGNDWTSHRTGADDPTAIWSDGPDHAIIVGESGMIGHWDGSAWTTVPGLTTDDLFAVWGSGPDDAFAAGAGGTLLHFDGDSWSAQASGTEADIVSIWGSGADDVYAVAPPSTVLHYTSGVWTPIDVGAKGDVYGVGGTSATDVNVVGDGIRRFDGSAWSADGPSAPNGLRAYFATSPSDRWAVGAAIFHDTGSGWVSQDSGTDQPLHDVSGADGEVWVAGDDQTLLRHAR